MPHSFFSLILIFSLSLFSLLSSCRLISSEVIVSDNFGNYVGLPLTGGNATGGYSISDSAISTSPYLLTVYINDGINNGYEAEEQSQFWIADGFYQASLSSSTFESIATAGGPPSGIVVSGPTPSYYLASENAPNTARGIYVFNFSIPNGQVLILNMTYVSLANPVLVDRIRISINNPLIPLTHPPNTPEITGDPQFIGFRGQSYQIHGVDGAVYNLITEPQTQVNSRFVFLSSGKCPVLNDIAPSNCWSHPGSYLGQISFQQMIDGVLHSALVIAGSHNEGFASIEMNDESLSVGQRRLVGTEKKSMFSVSFNSTHTAMISTPHYDFILTNSDMFINQAVRVKVPLSVLSANKAHGLLGQTYSNKVHKGSQVAYIEGNVDDYVIEDDDIYGTKFVYNRFLA